MTGRSVWSRVGRLETARSRRGGGACGVCGGGGYPGVFVMTGGEGSEPEQVGAAACAGCGRVHMNALVVLPGGDGWAGDDHDDDYDGAAR